MKNSVIFKRKFIILSALACSISPGMAFAQSLENAAPKSDRQIVDEFIAQKKAEHTKTNEVQSRRSTASDGQQMRKMIRAINFDRPKPTDSLPTDVTNQLSDLLATDAADYLTSLGWKPNAVQQLTKNGFDAGNAAIRVIRGGSSQLERIVLAPYVVKGKIVSVRTENLNDGFGQTISFAPEMYLASPNGKPLPETLMLRQSSGEMTSRGQTYYSGDFTKDDVGRSVILLLSDDRYLQRSSEKGKNAKSSNQSEAFVVQSADDVLALKSDGNTIESPQMSNIEDIQSLQKTISQYRK